ncbi:major facilitator superfamily domain-containing protein [Suillus paluster]|uniref:major facilitator superfamily domain-containing protein n=1 Tax=Suillus paluster TaxID=48578 RepID=UPI001B8701AB|nr:major facilitator superfamily domain-containing protein [Suillus paluster]KAG1738443.1 major facilitator superfamily domain-containing protein [Suillus paluster]
MDTADCPRTESETTPLIPEGASKRSKTPLPKFQMGIILVLQLVEPMTSMSIFPYINQLIRNLGITGGDDAAVGYYAGIIESLFFVAQALMVLRWSRLSDRIGRKPVLAIGLLGTCISMLCFGLSTTFWSLVVSRCICGALNGNIGVLRTTMAELTDSTNMAQGSALLQVFWRVGTFVGPLIGGMLARPQDNWPRLFAHAFWSKYPYFLPCAACACIVVSAYVMLLFFEETLSTKRRSKLISTSFGVPSGADIEDREMLAQKSMAVTPMRSLLTPTIVIPIANFALLAFLDISLRTLMPLFFSMPMHLGGLGFSPSSIGSWLALLGIADCVLQALFFAKIVNWLGPKRLFCMAVSCFPPVMLVFPIVSWLVHTRGFVDHAITFLLLGQLVLTLIWSMAFGARHNETDLSSQVTDFITATVFMFITASAPAKNVLGAINGLGQTSASVARAIGPALATSLFAFSKEHNLLNGNAVFVVLIVLASVLRWLGSQLPDELQDRDE